MSHNKNYSNKGQNQGNSSNGNNGHLNKKYQRRSDYNNNYNKYKSGVNHEVLEEKKDYYNYDYNDDPKGKYGGVSNEDFIDYENYEILQKENKNLKDEIKNLKEKKEKAEQENQKLKNMQKESEKNENNYKAKIEKNEKNLQDLKNQKNIYEYQAKEKEREINSLKIEKEKKLDELKTVQKEKNNYLDELNKQKVIIAKLEEQKLELEKSLENEKKKNATYKSQDILIKEKDAKISLFKNKFELIKNIISAISDTMETQDGETNKNISLNLNEEQNKEKEEEKVEEETNNFTIKNGYGNGKVGIINLELNCYMSSVIQILKNIKDFSEKILNINNIDDDILSSLKKLIYSLYYSKKNSIYISEFKTNFSKVYQNFEGRKSNDSTFFLIYLLSYLQKILPESRKKLTDISEFSFLNLNHKETEQLEKFLIKFESKNNSLIHDLFYNYQMSELICSGCNEAKVHFQGNNVLFLSLYDGTTKLKSLEQCINSFLFTKDKKGDKEFACSSCGKQTLSHVISIVKLPPVLVINLKRVGEGRIYSHDINIPYTLKTKNLEKLKKFNMEYELIGFIKHYGSEEDGHNVAYTKNIFDQKWYEFNDTKVKSIYGYPETDRAFLLFYQFIH
jgi:ubiquitin C-terminal hydrolase